MQILLAFLLIAFTNETYGVIRYCEFSELGNDFKCQREISGCEILENGESTCYIERCIGNTHSIKCSETDEDPKKQEVKNSDTQIQSEINASQRICNFSGSEFTCRHESSECSGRAGFKCSVDEN